MEREFFFLTAGVSGFALILVLVALFMSRTSEIEQANQIGEAGEHLIVLEASRARVGFRNTTKAAIDRAIERIVCVINRRSPETADARLRRVTVSVTRPPGVEVDVHIEPAPGAAPEAGTES